MKKGHPVCELSEKLLSAFSEYLNRNMGLFYPKRAWSEFEKKIPQITSSFGFENQSECIEWIIGQPVTKDLICTLAEHLTIGETYFFRDRNTFNLLESKILESIIAERRRSNQKQIKIWSAACCTGEEPYTISMILSELLPDLKNWNISIMGTDINIEFLRKAKQGVYRDWALRSIPDYYLNKYFTKGFEGFTISSEIRKMVRFSYLNLIEDQYPSFSNGTNNVDLILCNNVLIYFSENQIQRVVSQLEKSLVEGGHLCVTPIEASYVNAPTLTIRSDVGCNIFRSERMQVFNREKQQQPILKDISKGVHQNNVKLRKKSSFFESFLKKKPEEVKALKGECLQIERADELKEEVLLERINLLAKIGDYKEIVNEIEQYLEINSLSGVRDINLMKALIKAYVNIGNLDQAKRRCEECLEIENTNPSLHYLHAAIFQEFNHMDEAIRSLRKAIFLNSDFSIAYFTLGNILLMQDNFFDARKNFRNAALSLDKADDKSIVPETEELTVGRLKEIVEHILTKL